MGRKKHHKKRQKPATDGIKPLRKSLFQYAKPVNRNGKIYWYFNRKGFERVRLPDVYGSAEFQEAYKAALAGASAPPIEIGADRTKAGSVDAAIVTYYNSIDFGNHAHTTQRNQRFNLERFHERFGDLPLKGLTGQRIETIIAEKAPHAARNLLKALKGVSKVAKRAGMIDVDPTIGVCKPAIPDTGGFRTWTDEEIAQFESVHTIGTKARLALALLLWTGQRRSDAIRMGPQHILNGFIHVRQQKTGMSLQIFIFPELQEVLMRIQLSIQHF